MTKHNLSLAFLLICAMLATGVHGQTMPPSHPTLEASCDATTFLRDAEFFMPFTKGYTAAGFRLEPMLDYRPGEAVRLRVGAMLTGVAGTEGFWKAQPVVTLDYKAAPWMLLTMGTLDGSTSHRLDAPMHDPERWFYDYKEDGLQIRTSTRHWESDTWLNWEHFLEPWTPDQERFTLGSRHEIKLFATESSADKGFSLHVPMAFTGSHRGGQFTTLDTCIETLFNEQLALKAALQQREWRLELEAPCYFYQNMSPTVHTQYEEGWGLWPNIRVRKSIQSKITENANSVDIKAGYWRGHRYESARGSYLFQCTSWFDGSFAMPERHMLTLDMAFSHKTKDLELRLEGSLFHDLDLKRTDFVFGLTMHMSPHFKIL